ncbi:metal ABC transporter permease [Alicyclobacillus kakegawensis]|uniref:metal ABC transporter permease n=1 Tax=Alicyclobacillus kakegawensis TaxID=392012 RepID=UPI001FDFF9A7|nr:metal ABC transporter permease [Alicyclobacillus kakegawensis]
MDLATFVHSPFWHSPQVWNALYITTSAGVASAVVGVFIVMRGQSFAGHILTDVGATGASASFLVSINAWYGFLSFGLLAGAGMEVLGKRASGRDSATGLVLTFFMGLGALFLFLDTRVSNTADVTMSVLFGSVFTVDPNTTPWLIGTSVAILLLFAALYRPLLTCSIDAEWAQARGIPVRFIGLLFMLAFVVAAEDSALAMGALLSTAFLIGPAAAGVRLSHRMGTAIGVSALLATIAAWLGIGLAYASYNWPPAGRGYPCSFLVAGIIFLEYLLACMTIRWRAHIRGLGGKRCV